MDLVPFPSPWMFVGIVLVQAVVFVLLAAVGAWLAIRFEKWRTSRQSGNP